MRELIIQAGGEKFFVFADPNNTKNSNFTPQEINGELNGIIKAVPTKVSTAENLLIEEPNAVWFMDHKDLTGKPVPLSGNGIAAFVRFLLESGLHEMRDRRETIPIATRSGIKDTLVGVVGVSIDLGRWKLLHETSTSLLIRLGREHQVMLENSYCGEQRLNERLILVNEKSISVKDGIGQLRAKFFDETGGGHKSLPSSGTGAITAAIFARHFGKKLMPNATNPNHWKIETPGGTLAVRMFATQEGEHVSLNVPAEVIQPYYESE